jgi:hypothetical protein
MRVRTSFRQRIPGCLASIFTLFLAIGVNAPARADFLDDLFGGGSNDAPPPHVRPSRGPRDNFSIRLKEPRRQAAKQRKIARTGPAEDQKQYVAGSRPQKPLLCAAPGPTNVKADDKLEESTAYMRDETLRAGDSVVTPGEIVVFKGGDACPHAHSDFVSLARSGLPKVKRNALVSLQQGLKSPPRAFTVEDGKQTGSKIVGEARH